MLSWQRRVTAKSPTKPPRLSRPVKDRGGAHLRKFAGCSDSGWALGIKFPSSDPRRGNSFRVVFGDKYPALEKEAQDKFGLFPERSKPLIARHVAERIPVDAGSNAEKKLKEFSSAVEALKI